ncbi:membrane-associated phospholipid phosphatase [Pedobacter sp. UYP30]|uniref:phosphatase PAP2 family protein n=1 Tax=Pedobacter sp. UYP30 TaxID=1756400 RepID=UPI0033977405
MKEKLLAILFLCLASVASAQQFNKPNNSYLDSVTLLHPVAKQKFKVAPFILPTIFVTYGFIAANTKGALNKLDLSTKAELQEDHPLFAAHVDDYLQFAPVVAYYALNFSGVKGKHSLADASLLYITSATIMGGSSFLVKKLEGRLRPDSSGNNSFPSGHTASAFAAAEFLHQEYKDQSPFIAYSGFVVAAATGALRLYNNKHWLSDTVAGAGFGIASTKIAYLIYPYMKEIFGSKKHENISFMPSYQNGTPSLFFAAQF